MPSDTVTLRKQPSVELRLPTAERGVEPYRLGAPSPYPAVASGPFNRSRVCGRARRF